MVAHKELIGDNNLIIIDLGIVTHIRSYHIIGYYVLNYFFFVINGETFYLNYYFYYNKYLKFNYYPKILSNSKFKMENRSFCKQATPPFVY